jgi:hypothetical protein
VKKFIRHVPIEKREFLMEKEFFWPKFFGRNQKKQYEAASSTKSLCSCKIAQNKLAQE